MKVRVPVLLTLVSLLLLISCQRINSTVVLLADGQEHEISVAPGALPANLLSEAGVTLGASDRLFYLGFPIPIDLPLPEAAFYTLNVRRAVTITLVTPEEEKEILTSALTIGQVLAEAGFTLYAADRLDPPAGTPITGPLTVTYQPAQTLTITVDGTQVQVRSAASTVAQALAESGIPLVGLDYASPTETKPLPKDGQIRVVHVVESIALAQKEIPYSTRTEISADLELDQQALLQGGEPGLAIARTRTRTEDGVQVSQQSESESIVRPPQDRILGFGSKIVIRTAVVDGVTIEYWRALNLYATYYVPCDSAGKCYYGTSSGKKVQKGVVALVYPWYMLFGGQPLYIPGYGHATVEDTNGANTSAYWGTYWIDLGYAQTDNVDWVNHYVTVYFLTPVPDNPGYILP